MNPFLRFFSNENKSFSFRPKQNKSLNALKPIYADQQFTGNIYFGRVASLFGNILFFRKIIVNTILQ